MEPLASDIAPAEIAAAIEANTSQFLMELGEAGGGETRDDTVRWTIGGSPIDYHNAIVAAALSPQEADAAIAASIERLKARGVPGSWHVGPSMTPPDIGRRLLRAGFSYAGDDVGMAAALDKLTAEPVPAAFSIDRVGSDGELDEWVETLGQGFGEGLPEAQWVGSVYSKLGLDDANWRHYLGRLDGRPVATATMFLSGGVAGIYFVFTLPAARRQGIGAAMTRTPLEEARRLGYRLGVLGASVMGEPVYRRMGFAEYCRIGIYEWR
jgi:GNAT superfamily N-acetyltransferase